VRAALGAGHDVSVVKHGAIAREGDPSWVWLAPPDPNAPASLASCLKAARPEVVIFASSVRDTLALALARAAQAAGVPVLHALDSWTGYRTRMEMDGLPTFVPDAYAVPDQLAHDDALADGIPQHVLRVTGQPAFAGPGWYTPPAPSGRPADGRCKLLFVSEPAEADHGLARGYTEHTSLALLCRGLQPLAGRVTLDVLPHPRHEKGLVEKDWQASRGALDGGVIAMDVAVGGLCVYDGVSGMASVLLYQAWLLGRPVISVQPNLKFEPLRQWSRRPGIVLVDGPDDRVEPVTAWAETIRPGRPIALRPELTLHKDAAERILSLAEQLASRTDRRTTVS
jgi:hypothetical protein